jgi:hypothetical protein
VRACSIEVYDFSDPEDNTTIADLVAEEEIGEGWLSIIANRPVSQIVMCFFDAAEEVIGWIGYESGQQDVRVEEALRPEEIVYQGPRADQAENFFWDAVTKRVRN